MERHYVALGEAVEKAKKALADAEIKALVVKSAWPCICLAPPGTRKHKEFQLAKLEVKQAEQEYQESRHNLDSFENVLAAQESKQNLDSRMDSLVSQVAGLVSQVAALNRNLSADASRHDVQVNTLVRTLSSASPHVLDPWASTLRSQTPRPEYLREEAARHYGLCEIEGDGSVIAQCCLTGITGGRNKVTNAHLLPRNAPAHFLEALGFQNVDDVRNMVPLCKNIDKAFEQEQLCFLPVDEYSQSFVLKIWDPKIKNKLVFHNDPEKRTIGSYSGQKMTFEEGKTPFTRVLSLHAQCSYETALRNKWITPDEPKPSEYGTPLQHDTLSIRKMNERATSPETTQGISSSSWHSPPAANADSHQIADRQQSSNSESLTQD